MAHREHIRQLALSVGRGLKAYIDVHDTIFEQASTFKSLIKNLFGRGVPMAALLADSEALVPVWVEIRTEVAEFRRSAGPTLTPDERRYLDILERYMDALERTVAALIERQRLLAEGSKSRRNSPMTWETFQEAQRRYQEAINEYKVVGLDLNNAAPIIFD